MKRHTLVTLSTLLVLASGLLQSNAQAQTLTAQTLTVQDAWARPTVAGQKTSGAYMKITARENLQLVGASSPVAGVTEVHEMKMEGDVMKMRALPVLELPAGKTVELKPGGYHVMLMDLKTALPKDSSVPLTLVLKNAQGVQSRQDVTLRVGAPAAASAAGAGMGHDAGHGHGMKH